MTDHGRGWFLFVAWFVVALLGLGISALLVGGSAEELFVDNARSFAFMRNAFFADVLALPFLWKSHGYAKVCGDAFLKRLTEHGLKANIGFAVGLLFLSLALLQQTYHFV